MISKTKYKSVKVRIKLIIAQFRSDYILTFVRIYILVIKLYIIRKLFLININFID